jgi:hypothetical protein
MANELSFRLGDDGFVDAEPYLDGGLYPGVVVIYLVGAEMAVGCRVIKVISKRE